MGIIVILILFGSPIIACVFKYLKDTKPEREKLKQVKSGTWAFPTLTFYQKCKEAKVSKVTDKYHFEKMRMIAKSICHENKIPAEYYDLYCSDEKVKEYFFLEQENETAKRKASEAAKIAAAEAEKKAYFIPQKSNLTEYDIERINLYSSLRSLYGREKREFYLKYEIAERKRSLDNDNNTFDLSTAILASVHQEPEHNWAALGGIASGIAGPVAGAAIASQALAENQRIRESNAQNRAAAVALATQVSRSSYRGLDREECKKNIAHYEEQVKQLEFKLVFDDISTQEVFDSLVFTPKLNRSELKRPFLTLTIKNQYEGKIPKGLSVVVDGTVQVRVYCDDILVDDVCVALPLEGISCGKKYDISYIHLKNYMVRGKDRVYRFEIVPNKLWLMEA